MVMPHYDGRSAEYWARVRPENRNANRSPPPPLTSGSHHRIPGLYRSPPAHPPHHRINHLPPHPQPHTSPDHHHPRDQQPVHLQHPLASHQPPHHRPRRQQRPAPPTRLLPLLALSLQLDISPPSDPPHHRRHHRHLRQPPPHTPSPGFSTLPFPTPRDTAIGLPASPFLPVSTPFPIPIGPAGPQNALFRPRDVKYNPTR